MNKPNYAVCAFCKDALTRLIDVNGRHQCEKCQKNNGRENSLESLALDTIRVTCGFKLYRRKKDFLRVLREMAKKDADIDDLIISEALTDFRFIPDSWGVMPGNEERCPTIVCVEVEDHSKLTKEKLRAYAWLWFATDSYRCELELRTYNRYGTNFENLDLGAYYWRFFHGVSALNLIPTTHAAEP